MTDTGTDGVRVQPVLNQADLQAFIDLPLRLHPRGRYVPHWQDAIRRWWTGDGPHREHGDVELVLARDPAGTVVGRSTVHSDTRMDDKLGTPTQLLGLTEFVDTASLLALVAYVEQQARAAGRTSLLGPVALLPNQVGGVVTSGHDQRGFVDSPWNPSHYPAAWAAAAFAPFWPAATWICDDLAGLDADVLYPAGAGTEPDGIELHRGSRRRLGRQLPVLRRMLNASFTELPYYTPITAAELEVATDGLAFVLDESLLLWLTRDGEPVAFVLTVPDLSEFVMRTGGRMALRDQLRLLLTRRRYRDEAILIIKGTVPDARGGGLMSLLSHRLLTNLQAGGYRTLRVTFIGEDNAASAAQFEAMGGRPLHDVAFYRKDLAPLDQPAQHLLDRREDWGRAPSAHNSQPWLVRSQAPDTLALGWHADRVLEVGDPTRRDLMLSLGCVAEAIAITAAELGYAASVQWEVDRAARHAGLITLEQAAMSETQTGQARRVATPPSETLPVEALPGKTSPGKTSAGRTGAADARFTVAELRARRTARGPYARSDVDAVVVRGLAWDAGLPGGGNSSGLGDPTDGVDLTILPSALVEEALWLADRWTFEGPATTELRDWLRLDPRHPRYHLDGLSDKALELARWEAIGLGLALRSGPLAVLRTTRLTTALAASAQARPLGSVVALTAPVGLDDDATGDLGRHLLRVWLAAGRQGLSAHPLSQLLDCPQSAALVAGHLGSGRAAYAVFRVGRPKAIPVRSARLTG